MFEVEPSRSLDRVDEVRVCNKDKLLEELFAVYIPDMNAYPRLDGFELEAEDCVRLLEEILNKCFAVLDVCDQELLSSDITTEEKDSVNRMMSTVLPLANILDEVAAKASFVCLSDLRIPYSIETTVLIVTIVDEQIWQRAANRLTVRVGLFTFDCALFCLSEQYGPTEQAGSEA
ncbi:hypothetical protein Q1695_000148 [Nippostrongylus brasiliensis]|nr:hypothetical protein Q1695_000148 [Nippostrongylus brasiliensis]